MLDDLSRLRREASLAPDDVGVASRLAVALARAGEIEPAAREYMKLHARLPEIAVQGLGALLADPSLKPEDAAWLVTVFGGDRRQVTERAIEVARVFAQKAGPESARDVILSLGRFPDLSFVSVIVAFARARELRALAIAALRTTPAATTFAPTRSHRFAREIEELLREA